MIIYQGIALMVFSGLFGFLLRIGIEQIKKPKESEEELDTDFLIKHGVLQFNLLSEKLSAGRRSDYWVKRWKKNRIPVELFKSYFITIPILFSQSLLGKDHWTAHVVEYNYQEGWYDIVLKKRHREDVPLRLHYIDLTIFNEACNKVVGMDTAVLTILLQEATLVAIRNKKNVTEDLKLTKEGD